MDDPARQQPATLARKPAPASTLSPPAQRGRSRDTAASSAPPPAPPPAPPLGDDVVVLLLVELKPAAWLWGWSRIVLRDRPLRRVRGVRFAKALGSGHGGGFGLRPSGSRQGLFTVFANEADADAFITTSTLVEGYRARSRELCIAKLRATSSRGHWSGESISVTAEPRADGPVASLTRASIRPRSAFAFWRRSPQTELALQAAPGCRLAVGLGEAPLLRQATFSVWDDQAAMDAYARSGAHQDAICAAQHEHYFSESMFVRFAPLQITGTWHGQRHG